MTNPPSSDTTTQLHGAVTSLYAVVAPTWRTIDGLAEPPHSKPVRDALRAAAEHVRIACVLLEATAEVTDCAAPGMHELAERALTDRTRRHTP